MKFFTWVYLAITLILVAASLYVIFNPTGKGVLPPQTVDTSEVVETVEPQPDTSASLSITPLPGNNQALDTVAVAITSPPTATPDTFLTKAAPVDSVEASTIESPLSISKEFTSQAPPAAPRNLHVEVDEDDVTVLYWESPSDDVKNFFVSWSEDIEIDYREFNPVPGDRAFLELPNYRYSVTRWFRVRAENDYGASLESKPLRLDGKEVAPRHIGYNDHYLFRAVGSIIVLLIVAFSRLHGSRWRY